MIYPLSEWARFEVRDSYGKRIEEVSRNIRIEPVNSKQTTLLLRVRYKNVFYHLRKDKKGLFIKI